MNAPRLTLTPRRAGLIDNQHTELDVLIAFAAPDAPLGQRERAPLNLAIVIDRSGSMAGRPLAEAKRCADYIIQQLGPRDRAAVVVFDDAVRVLSPSVPAEPKEPLTHAVRAIVSGGMTALHDGWLEGAEQAAPYVASGAIARVLLLTDGQANRGETRPDVLAADCARLAASGVSTSTYGLGANFQEELLGAMAEAGGGQAYYGETAEDLMDPFREEFDLLSALCARKLRLKLEPNHGVDAQVLNAFRTDQEGRIMLPDLAFGGVAWALARLRVPATLAASPDGLVHVLSAAIDYEDNEGQAHTSPFEHLRLKRLPAAAFAALVEDEATAMRAQELRAAELMTLARQAAQNDDWGAVDQILARAQAEAGQNAWVAATIAALQDYADQRNQASFSKESYYSSRKKRMRLAFGQERAGSYSFDEETGKPLYARRKNRQGKDMDKDMGPKGEGGA